VRAEQPLPRFDPCLPRPALVPPAGPGWIHEIMHDGFRILAHRRGRNTRLFTRNGHNFADRFPLIAEAIVCGDGGLAVFDLIRGHATNAGAVLCAFNLLEVNGEDIRREPLEDRKRRLAGLLRLQHEGIAINEHFSARVRARLRGDRVEAAGLPVSSRPLGALAEGQESGGAGGEARGEEEWS
jgi:ATP-dependent DNA ligase